MGGNTEPSRYGAYFGPEGVGKEKYGRIETKLAIEVQRKLDDRNGNPKKKKKKKDDKQSTILSNGLE
jgi:hypothetical protein